MAAVDIVKQESVTYWVTLTEQTLKELIHTVEAAKKQYFNPPVKTITIHSDFSDVNFIVSIEESPNTQESLGYRLDGVYSDSYPIKSIKVGMGIK